MDGKILTISFMSANVEKRIFLCRFASMKSNKTHTYIQHIFSIEIKTKGIELNPNDSIRKRCSHICWAFSTVFPLQIWRKWNLNRPKRCQNRLKYLNWIFSLTRIHKHIHILDINSLATSFSTLFFPIFRNQKETLNGDGTHK